MKKAAALSMVCLSLLLMVCVTSVRAQTVTVGVAKGDKFTYLYALHGTPSDSYPWQAWIPDENQSNWKITITDVEGTTITYQLQVVFANGTQASSTSQTLDVSTGSTSDVNYMFFVGSNLNVNDSIYPNGFAVPIDQVTSQNFLNEQRQAIHITFGTPGETFEAFSDRQTGVLTQLNDAYYDNSATVSLTLVYSNVWAVSASATDSPVTTPSVPEIPTIVAIPLLMVGILAGVAAYKAKQKKASK